ncbi:MAG: hypothetical protein OXC80_09760 [Gammaproteobacteria bacterium]|nr:hypothetical protein [Gammaproteobacteria bacterium]
MSVYEHQQGTYQSYRVARSINGQLRQAYFPRTQDGYQEAQQRDQQWAQEQLEARRKSSASVSARFAGKPPLSAQSRHRIKNADQIAELIRRIQNRPGAATG